MANVLPACLLLALLVLTPALLAHQEQEQEQEQELTFRLVRGDQPWAWHRMLPPLQGTRTEGWRCLLGFLVL